MITIQDHSAITTSKVVDKFEQRIPVLAGFSAMFPEETTGALAVDVAVSRNSDLISVDVARFTEGRKNKFTGATEKKYIPPFHKEDYDFVRDEVYMNTVALGIYDNANVNKLIAKRAYEGVESNRLKIERAIRKQQADVLQTGIITLKNGDNINFGRQAASMPVRTGVRLWSAPTTALPITDISEGLTFLRDEGQSNGNSVNVVMRTAALTALMATDQFKASADFRRIERMDIGFPEFSEATGMTFHGRITAGDFVVNLWTYNEKYTNDAGDTVYYLREDLVVMIPSDFRGKTIFGGLPAMQNQTIQGAEVRTPSIVEAKYLVRSYADEKTISSTIELTSAPIVVPFEIDKIFTIKVL